MIKGIYRFPRGQCAHTGSSRIRGILRDYSGNVLPLAAAGLVVLAALVGGGVDMARAYKAERRLQAACDAGALAGRRAVTTSGFDSTAQAQATQYFNANFDDAQQQTTNTVFTPSSTDNGNTVVGTATAQLNTIIMKIFGFENFNLRVNCSASMGVGNSDIMFVLDNTGSMDDAPDGDLPDEPDEVSKIVALRTAMKAFYDTVETSVSGSNARIRYGFVPYNTTVNVGRLLTAINDDYLVDSMTVQSRKAVNWTGVVRTWTGTEETPPEHGDFDRYSDTRHRSLSDCNSAKPADTSWSTYGSPYTTTSETIDQTNGQKVDATGEHQDYRYSDYECLGSGTKYYVYRSRVYKTITSYEYEARDPVPVTTAGATYQDLVWQPMTYDVTGYKTFTSVARPNAIDANNNGTTDSGSYTSTWGGCIQERQTTPAENFTFVSLESGITPSEALDLDIDAAPAINDDDTRWRPLWPEVTFLRGSAVPYALNGSSNYASAACPYQARLFAEMSKTEFDSYANNLVTDSYTYHDIGLIWGARLSSPTGIWADQVNAEPSNGGTVSRHLVFMTDGALDTRLEINTAYGIERLDRRVTDDGTVRNEQLARHRSRYLAICEAIKARGIRLWVVAFGTTLTNDLQTCGSENSSFQADDAEELDEQFQEIAKQVGELRIIQ